MNGQLEYRARRAFSERFGTDPEEVTFAPGRVNLIGEHVDYNDGLVLPMPIAQGTAVAWSRTDLAKIQAFAADFDELDQFAPAAVERPETPGWRSYLRGMAAQWGNELPGMQISITGDLPRGSGLSSSASMCIALGHAFAAASGNGIEAIAVARRAQRTEHEFAGVACGIMDQMAVAAGEAGHAMRLDCRDLTYSQLRIPANWAVLVVDSGVTRGLVDGEYNARRVQCDAAARALGVTSLRDATLADLANAKLSEVEARRAGHVISEIERVKTASKALAVGDIAAFGRTLQEGHQSLRDDFEVSHPEVDKLVSTLQEIIGEEGGARMTGAGFGGSVVAVISKQRAAVVQATLDRTILRVI